MHVFKYAQHSGHFLWTSALKQAADPGEQGCVSVGTEGSRPVRRVGFETGLSMLYGESVIFIFDTISLFLPRP